MVSRFDQIMTKARMILNENSKENCSWGLKQLIIELKSIIETIGGIWQMSIGKEEIAKELDEGSTEQTKLQNSNGDSGLNDLLRQSQK